MRNMPRFGGKYVVFENALIEEAATKIHRRKLFLLATKVDHLCAQRGALRAPAYAVAHHGGFVVELHANGRIGGQRNFA